MKSIIIVSILAFSIVLVSVNVNANNSTWGFVGPYDRLLASDSVTKSKTWFVKQTADVVYPPKGHVNQVTLTAVRAWDWGGRKNFGYASLVKGGRGYRNATIHLKSQSGRALNFTIEYYGR